MIHYKQSKGFTLIEVLVSVAILAVVATALLQINSNSKQNFSYLKQRIDFEQKSSLASIHNDPKLHNKDLELYDFVKESYPTLSESLRKELKKYKIHYEQEAGFATISPQDQNKSSIDLTNERTSSAENISLIFDKITITHLKNSSTLFKITIPFSKGLQQ